jgi:hypothetical protein
LLGNANQDDKPSQNYSESLRPTEEMQSRDAVIDSASFDDGDYLVPVSTQSADQVETDAIKVASSKDLDILKRLSEALSSLFNTNKAALPPGKHLFTDS